MRTQADIFTTYEISRLLSVDISTVINWINQEKLPAYRTPGGHRRVRKEDLFSFAKVYGIPLKDTPSERVILIVEDDADFRRVVKDLVKIRYGEGLSVFEADDGFMAGKMTEELGPDVVILDLYLPGINGFKVCEDIRRDPDLRGTRILAISGHNTEEIRARILKAGADDFLPKPFGLDQLGLALDALLKRNVDTAKQPLNGSQKKESN